MIARRSILCLSDFVAASAVAFTLALSCATAADPLIPLTELNAATYRGETGGLYGGGENTLPSAQRRVADASVARIQPLDAAGKPSAAGKIVLLSIGMSNTTQEFSAFMRLANQDRRKRTELVLVDGAQGGADAATWAGTQRMPRSAKTDAWDAIDVRLQAAGTTRAQVQAAWIKLALAGPGRYGEFPAHA